jgi:adenylate cyclase
LRYLFEDYVLDTDRRELCRAGEFVGIEPKAFDLLVHVIANHERVVSKDDLIAAVWEGRIVSESALTSCINAARVAIGDSGEAQRLIRTFPRKGIRFVGGLRQEQADVAGGIVADSHEAPRSKPGLPHKPSVAVLPFANMGGGPDQGYFADGITDDIITELSRFSDLFVIARNSSFQYKGRPVDVRQVGRELGVGCVLEGSVRRSGDRVRISAQLIDAATGAHRWAERYDRKLEDVFAIQDEVVRAIAPVLVAHLNKAEVERTLQKPPSTWHAHDYYLRGSETLVGYASSLEKAELLKARGFLELAISADPQYARAHVDLSFTYFTTWINRVNSDFLKTETLDRAHELARKAVQLEPNLPAARAQLGMVLSFKRRHDEAIAEFERAQRLNPNFNDWRFANSLVLAGDAARAIEVTDALVRLDPFYVPLAAGFLGLARYMLREYEPAIIALVEAAGRSPRHRPVRQWLAATYAQTGQMENAREEAAAVLQIQPDYTIQGMGKYFSPFKRAEDAEHLFDGFRKAGLPEN